MKKILFLLLFISIYSSPTHASAAVEDEGGLFTGSDKISGKIFNESCLGCHSGGTPRAPHATTFSAMSADYILETLNGVMSSQASHLTDKEKVKLAEY
ncbi:MAG: c-type cytochrome, partial [Hyphomicrobiales bacterium]|nr:c-type cytochrome [Hyphomicrobiales bacterium]